MPLRDMAHLMPQHRRQLVPVADGADQAKMNAKITARQGKRIDGTVTDQKNLPGKALLELRMQLTPGPGSSHQRLPDTLHVIDQHWVIHVIRVPVNTGGNAVANPALRCSRQLGVIAQGRKEAAWTDD